MYLIGTETYAGCAFRSQLCWYIPLSLHARLGAPSLTYLPIKVGMKSDAERTVGTQLVTFHLRKNIPYVEVSAKDGTNLTKPLELLAAQLNGYAPFRLQCPSGPYSLRSPSSYPEWTPVPAAQNASTSQAQSKFSFGHSSAFGEAAAAASAQGTIVKNGYIV